MTLLIIGIISILTALITQCALNLPNKIYLPLWIGGAELVMPAWINCTINSYKNCSKRLNQRSHVNYHMHQASFRNPESNYSTYQATSRQTTDMESEPGSFPSVVQELRDCTDDNEPGRS